MSHVSSFISMHIWARTFESANDVKAKQMFSAGRIAREKHTPEGAPPKPNSNKDGTLCRMIIQTEYNDMQILFNLYLTEYTTKTKGSVIHEQEWHPALTT